MDEDCWQNCQNNILINTHAIIDRFLCVFHFRENI
jgi:hypothetical protein